MTKLTERQKLAVINQVFKAQEKAWDLIREGSFDIDDFDDEEIRGMMVGFLKLPKSIIPRPKKPKNDYDPMEDEDYANLQRENQFDIDEVS